VFHCRNRERPNPLSLCPHAGAASATGAGSKPRARQLFTGSGPKKPFHNPLKSLEYFTRGAVFDGVIHMHTPWTLSTLGTVLFCGLVVSLSGAGIWATIIH
jgi:hypothetical protein